MKRKISLFLTAIICLSAIFVCFSQPVLAYDEEYPLVIVLDPGHGGIDPGAGNGRGGNEREINLKIALYCKAELEKNPNVKVYLTRTTNDLSDSVSKSLKKDGKIPLSARGNYAGKMHANAFISIHCNSSTSSSVRGAEVYYPINVSWCTNANYVGKGLSASILNQLGTLGITKRGTFTRTTTKPATERYPDGSLMDYYTVINSARSCHVPGLIIEHAFINNTADFNAFLSTDQKLKNLGIADAKGIINYFKTNNDKWIFNDVCLGKQWYSECVKYMKDNGYINGYQNGCFGPTDRIQRQDFVVILANMKHIDPSLYNYKSKFPDVKEGSYYNAAVNWACSEHIINGYDNGKFGVCDYLTREQMVTILYNYAKDYLGLDVTPESELALTFNDYEKTSAFAKDPMIWAVDKGLINGYNSTTLGPRYTAERSHVAKVLMNAELKNLLSEDLTPPKPDQSEPEFS